MIWFLFYLATIVLANATLQAFGMVPFILGPVPAGVIWAGLAFTVRDQLQEAKGRRWVTVAILTGSALSAFISPAFALASAAAFLVSEAIDFAIYTWVRPRGWPWAVTTSNIAGGLVDSIIFLWLAFGVTSLVPVLNLTLGKALMILPVLVVWRVWRSFTYRELSGQS